MSTVQFGLENPRDGGLVAAGSPVEAPVLMPNPINLVRASRTPADTTGGRWVNGFSYSPEGRGEIGIDDQCSGEHVDSPGLPNVIADWMPYILSARYECSTFGYHSQDYVGRAERLLDAATPKLLEWEFWGGGLATAAGHPNGFLADGNQSVSLTATSMESAVGQLEDALGDCGAGVRGIIHCPPYAAAFMGTFTRREGNLLLTNRDTIVVPGSGYAVFHSGGGPFDMYATGITDVRLGDIMVHDPVSIDRAANLVTIRAYRYGVVSWDQSCHAKVTVTLP